MHTTAYQELLEISLVTIIRSSNLSRVATSYVSYACPWAHRTLIYRKLKGLDEHISFDVVSPDMLEEGWVFDETFPGATTDSLFSSRYLREIYQRADSQITTSVTVPILWDKKTNTIVNNESSEIIRMFNTSFNKLTANATTITQMI